MFYILTSRTKLTMDNLKIAFPELTKKERRTRAKKCYENFAASLAFNTLIMSGRITNKELLDIVEVDGWDNFEMADEMSDQGILIFSAHIGNWELMLQYAALRTDKQVHAIARKVNNPLLEERIIGPFRDRFGLNILYKKNALIHIIKAIRRGEYAGFMIDQKLRPNSGGIMVDFFGKKAPTVPSAALMQVRFGTIVLPAFMVKLDNGKYRLIIREPIKWEDNGKSMDDQILELSHIHQKIVEEIIREYPDQWFWMHDRWDLKRNYE